MTTIRETATSAAEGDGLRLVELAVCAACNLRCRHCYQSAGRRSNIYLSVSLIAEVLRNACELGSTRVILTGGEPLKHPQFRGLLQVADRLGLRKTVFTNGTLVTPQLAATFRRCRVDSAQVSLDGFCPMHEALRGPGTFALAVAGIRALLDAGVSVQVNTQLSAALADRLEEWINFLQQEGVSEVSLTITGALGNARTSSVSTSVHAIEKALQFTDTIPQEPNKMEHCGALQHRLAIHFDGNVYPCDFFKSLAQYSLGNVYQTSLTDIYRSWCSRTSDLSQFLKSSRPHKCHTCDKTARCSWCAARVFAAHSCFRGIDPICEILTKDQGGPDEGVSPSDLLVGFNSKCSL